MKPKKHCPVCSGKLIESYWKDTKKKCYVCKNNHIFDYNDPTPCCGHDETMIISKTVGPNRDAILSYYCQKCNKKYREKRLKEAKESYISEK